MRRLTALTLWLIMTVPSAMAATPAEDSAANPAPALIGELLRNVNWELLLRLQQVVMDNFELIGPYTQEYIACLEAEGALDKDQALDLKLLIEKARNASGRCNAIAESLAGQLKFDITHEELERGLSPEYRELLNKSL